LQSLPESPKGYFPNPHKGGLRLEEFLSKGADVHAINNTIHIQAKADELLGKIGHPEYQRANAACLEPKGYTVK